MNLIGSNTFCFVIAGDILIQCSQLTNIIYLIHIADPIYRLPEQQLLNWLIFHVLSLNILSTVFLFNYRVIKRYTRQQLSI